MASVPGSPLPLMGAALEELGVARPSPLGELAPIDPVTVRGSIDFLGRGKSLADPLDRLPFELLQIIHLLRLPIALRFGPRSLPRRHPQYAIHQLEVDLIL